MDTINKSIMTKLAKHLFDFDERRVAPITEVNSVDWDKEDKYITIRGHLYLEEDPEDYITFTAYSYRIYGHGLITEFDCETYDGLTFYYYWVSEIGNILPKDLYENWECQVSMLNEEE